MTATRVHIIILNWNNWQDTIHCLESVFRSEYTHYHIILVDNGSTNESVEKIRQFLELQDAPLKKGFYEKGNITRLLWESRRVTLLLNEKNEGFAGGCNAGVDYSLTKDQPDYIFLLNNDAVLTPDCLGELVRFAEEKSATIVSAVAKNREGQLNFTGANPLRELFLYYTPKPESELPETWETGRVEGCAMLIRGTFVRQMYDQHGYLFDPALFLYCEDTELCLHARQMGGSVWMNKRAVVYHEVSQAGGGFENPYHLYYSTRNRLRLAKRWLPWPLKVLFHLFFPLSRTVKILLLFLQRRSQAAKAMFAGMKDAYYNRYGQWRK